MKRTYLGICCMAILCMVWATGCCTCKAPEKWSPTQPNGNPADQKTIADLQARINKLELFAVLETTGYLSLRKQGIFGPSVSMPSVIILSKKGNRFAEQWVKDVLARASTITPEVSNIAYMYACHPDPSVRDKDKALEYAKIAYSKIPTNNPDIQIAALSALSCAYAINGDFKHAIETQEQLIPLQQNRVQMISTFRTPRERPSSDSLMSPYLERLEMFKKGLPYIQPRQTYYHPLIIPHWRLTETVEQMGNSPSIFDSDLPPFGSDL